MATPPMTTRQRHGAKAIIKAPVITTGHQPPGNSQLIDALAFWRNNPVEAVKDWFGVTPEDYQAEILMDLFCRYNRVSVKSGHGVGKTSTEAWALWIYLNTRSQSRVVATAAVKDLGVFGTVYPINEKNIMQVLMEKLKSGEGKKAITDFEVMLKNRAEEAHFIPKPAESIKATLEYRTYLFNPGVSLSQDVQDHEGTRFYTKGDVVNPLDHVTLSKEYLFIDGDRHQQVEWAKTQQQSKKVMIVLLKGDPMKIMKDHGIQVFFDQEGAMVNRFQLTRVPCVMRQEDKMLHIEEIPEEDLMP
jgi:conjugal transfer pilus assembly protein TraW